MAGNKPDEDNENGPKSAIVEEIDLQIKHPLHNTWVLWYYDNDRKKSWAENLKEITSFSTVEDFWSLYNHIKAASELKPGSDYSLFKKGIRPMWEDDANKQGGRWLISLEKRQREIDLDNCWLEIMLCMIGESFEGNADEVNGATVNVRPKVDKIGLWTADADKSKADVNMAIGRKIKDRLNLSNRQQIHFQLHRDTQTKSGSAAKNTFSI
ncbi:hypothetical protein GE061_019378 [Apolygus lucorum]|uniref:eIF-4F 25 kDa subunit n=1 Tax=Apolygus lucorum TaxID=248454 RepID=A0A8S9XA84_APOLU|nr:hypothetical protein GE061_019378 [Apolygus lucorum]